MAITQVVCRADDPEDASGETVGNEPANDVQIELPYARGAVVPGATYGVSVQVFAADGFPQLAASEGNIPVDLASGEALVKLTPASP